MTNRARGEGALYYDKSRDRWIGEIYDTGGTRHRISDRTKTGASKKLAEHRAIIDGGAAIAAANLTVASVLGQWLAGDVVGNPDRALSSIQTYCWCVDRLVDVLGKVRVRSMTVRQIEAGFLLLAAGDDEHRPLGKGSIIKARSALAQAFDDAIRLGDMQTNIARLAKLPRNAKASAPGRALSYDQARELLTVLPGERLGAMFTVMLTVGLRPGEAAGLLWESVDLDAGVIAVEHAVRTENGAAVLVDQLKTERSRRRIALPPFVVTALRRHRVQQTAQRLAATRWDDDRLVFATRVGTPLGARNVARDLRGITESLGLGDWSPNELRHSAATILSKVCKLSDREVADILGHETTQMFTGVYNHQHGVVAHAAAPMEAMFG